ncbi:MAG: PolC-type DNA polymerase III [bacterium]|nr:PolC-type DNA polymerase III [bacterium]
MGKLFYEVFPTLEVSQELQSLLAETTVEKISSNHARDRYCITIYSHRLIPKKLIFQLEKDIHKQIFRDRELTVHIRECFSLSSQYTPKSLYAMYEDSIRLELREYSALLYNLFHASTLKFTDDEHMIVQMPQNVLATERGDELLEILDKIFCDRCGLTLHLDVEYLPPGKSKYAEESDQRIKLEVQRIVNRTSAAKKEADDTLLVSQSDEKAEKKDNSKKKDTKKQSERPTFNRNLQKRGKDSFNRTRSDNPDVIFGRDFEEDAMPIVEIQGEIGDVVIRGQILATDERKFREEKTIFFMTVTDDTDTMQIKMFLKNEIYDELKGKLSAGTFIKLKGVAAMDNFSHELTIGSVTGIKKASDFRTKRADLSVKKRVELHCHTKMSDMDGVSDVGAIIKQAIAFGHKSIAITDHGAVQAFPIANHSIPKGSDFKVIYGMEAYLVDDTKDMIKDPKGQTFLDDFVVFDLETTGFSSKKNKIIEIGAVKVSNGVITERFSRFVNPQVPIPFDIEELTGIRDDMVVDAPVIEEVLPEFMEFCRGCVMVAHNADFDMSFIQKNCEDMKLNCDFTVIDTVAVARFLLPQLNRYKLDTVAKALQISLDNHHRAVDDAACTAEIFVKFIEMLQKRKITTLNELNEQGKPTAETIQKMSTYHAIISAKNDIGRVNLYRLVSLSHLKYYHNRPRIPKSELNRYREGLIIGSACEAGELYRALVNARPAQEIARIVDFYDYLEIQPVGNNAFMLRDPKSPVNTVEDIQELNRQIVQLGEDFHKPVVATCDVHFLNPEDEIYRRIIMAGKGFSDADEQAPLFLRTTEEMLDEFQYLGTEKAEEIVITNTNKICDMCERIEPVRPDKCPPVIENSDQMLRDICYNKAHEMYGDPLPGIVEARLERELNSIISNGYAVMYIIAQKLVWKSNEDGYLVGSRGSVGSSFVATMAGITEVNPLSPHYYCSNCHFVDFDSPEVKAYAGRGGCDMPDRYCPNCGEPLLKDGFDIPFETFLGFKGDKEPDIDLNFSGDYQSKAHKYTEVIFGAGQTFRAGTIGTLAEKTAYGYVKKYFEERGVHKRSCEIERILAGCVGVRRTTGQHPGGIVVLPVGEDIASFTPTQHPANDMTTDIITTHFEYHSIDHNLLKLDILGHDDPTMIRMLEDLTGIDAQKIPLDDASVMSLFQNTSALMITPDDINGCKLGALGIPEFGTDFAMGMLLDTNPQEFSDLVRIAGLSHGTDVWLGNAQKLIQEGKATISTAICTRDDIMTYLIGKGLEPEESFKIMEAVRKGVVAKGKAEKWPEWEQHMREHDVPDWYIWSCTMIKYMFPKAHAAAYVMMAWRIAYCKVFYPLAYYAAFFSIRAKAFNYEVMCMGKERLNYYMADYERRSAEAAKENRKLPPVEQDMYRDMRIVQEMYARGYEFLPIDIYRADARYFQVIDGKLMAALNTIDGMGDTAADTVVEAAKDGPFLSREDFRQRTKVPQKIIENMADLGMFGDLPATNQISLFDLT